MNSMPSSKSPSTLKITSKLRAHAAPWSPRRRQWKEILALRAQLLTLQKASVRESPPTNVQNPQVEFDRILRKFVHMDPEREARGPREKFALATGKHGRPKG